MSRFPYAWCSIKLACTLLARVFEISTFIQQKSQWVIRITSTRIKHLAKKAVNLGRQERNCSVCAHNRREEIEASTSLGLYHWLIGFL